MLAIDTNVLLANVALVEALLRLTGKRYALGKPELCRVIKALILQKAKRSAEVHSMSFEDFYSFNQTARILSGSRSPQ